ncbi:hypothetical protein [Bryobacter aggregatus]|uniref:hypothetical protein n=1 Tax=Bryobacter aggregatus TaxID=360054 RepID=UPI0004E27417|nr:hypothetical protein [Bryobacter aggregatus]
MFEIKQMMESLIDQRAAGVDPRSFSDLFERLTWLLADNGHGIRSVLTAWLDSDDLYRVQVVLGLEEAFLFDRRAMMAEAFNKISLRWPEVKSQCDEILEAWDKSVPSDTSEQ